MVYANPPMRKASDFPALMEMRLGEYEDLGSLLAGLIEAGGETTRECEALLGAINFRNDPDTVELVEVSYEDFGIKWSLVNMNHGRQLMYERALRSGFQLCSASVGLEVAAKLIASLNSSEHDGSKFFIAMEPVTYQSVTLCMPNEEVLEVQFLDFGDKERHKILNAAVIDVKEWMHWIFVRPKT